MKLGVKTFDSEFFLDFFINKADFFEIMAIEKNNYKFLKKYSIPIVIHAQHKSFNVNNADKTKIKENIDSINFAINLANECKANKIIVHPGEITDENCSVERAVYFFNSINDKRILVENLITKDKKELCATPEEMKLFLKKTKAGFCFDINHAIETAIYLKEDYVEFIKKFIELKPAHYHLGGQNLKQKKDHINFKESDIDLKKILKLIPKNAEITLEVSTDIETTKEDLELIKSYI
jgi:sugar phosphate isomerase/epimerase